MFYPRFNIPCLNPALFFQSTPQISFASLAHQAYLQELSLQINFQNTLLKNTLLAQEYSLSSEILSQSTPYNSPHQSQSQIAQSQTGLLHSDSGSPDPTDRRQKDANHFEPIELQPQVERMLSFFVHTSNRINRDQKLAYKQKLSEGPYQEFLLQLFEILDGKFEKSYKARIDMLRLIVRKAISTTKKALKKKEKLGTGKEALKSMCHRYFQVDLTKKSHKEATEAINHYFPYLQESRNKTANSSFIDEIFSSVKFQEDYLLFYTQFPEMWEEEMGTRFKKFVEWIMQYVDEPEKIKEFKRLPWLNSCMESTKVIAEELLGRCRQRRTAEILIDDEDGND